MASSPRGGTRSENWWGCAAGRWKLDPTRSREKWNLAPKRSNSVRIGSFNTPKDRFGVGGWEKIPPKDRVKSWECQKRGSKRRHIHITQHRGSTLPGRHPLLVTWLTSDWTVSGWNICPGEWRWIATWIWNMFPAFVIITKFLVSWLKFSCMWPVSSP